MKYLKPKDIQLLSSTAVNELFPVWEAISYTVGEIVENNNALWKCLTTEVTQEPIAGNPQWVFYKTVNKLSCLDNFVNTQTIAENTLIMEIEVESCTTLTFLNLYATAIKIEQFDETGILLRTVEDSLYDREARDWIDYYLNMDFIFQSIYSFTAVMDFTQRFKITFTGQSAIKVGIVLAGAKRDLGCTFWGATAGIVDYSRQETDEFGNTQVVKRNFAKKIDIDVELETKNFTDIYNKLAELRSTPILYYARDGIKAFTVYGHYKSFTQVLQNGAKSKCSIDILGLI